MNFFQPSFRLLEKKRHGSRVVKRHEAPTTPCVELPTSSSVEPEMKERLRGAGVSLDPLRLLAEIASMQRCLASLSDGSAVAVAPGRDADRDRFLTSLANPLSPER